jgi:hypothetical protein
VKICAFSVGICVLKKPPVRGLRLSGKRSTSVPALSIVNCPFFSSYFLRVSVFSSL